MIKSIYNFVFPTLALAKGLNVAAAGMAAGAVGSAISSSNAADAQASAAANANAPWSAAQPYISGQFDTAQTALNNALGMGTYSGERVAPLNPYQTQGADQTAAYANGNGQATANQLYNTGSGMTNAGSAYGTNAQGLLTAAQSDPTQSFIDYGNQLANSSTTQSMVDQANLDTSRNLNETQLPSLAITAANNGNTDSTRTGVQQSLIQRNASEQMANTAANIRNTMFNTGMTTAQSQYNTNATNALAANAQVGNAYSLGNSALLNGQAANGNNFDQLSAAGGVYQGQQQAQDAAAQQQFTDQQTTPLNLVGQYMNVINGKWGGQAISSVGPSVAGSAIQGAAGGGLVGAGIAGKLGAYNGGSSPSAASLNGVGYDTSGLASYYNGAGNTFGFSTT